MRHIKFILAEELLKRYEEKKFSTLNFLMLLIDVLSTYEKRFEIEEK